MVKLLILSVGLLLISSTSEAARISEGRIVGGDVTDTNQIPYIVSLAFPNRNNVVRHQCGGSIIADNWILTAAHCKPPIERAVVRAGSALNAEGGLTAKVLQVIIHGNYSHASRTNDIALLKLDRSITGPKGGRIINMIERGEETPGGTLARVSGWGRTVYENTTISDVLRTVEVNVFDDSKCYPGGYNSKNLILKQGTICASSVGKDACTNDSGGPLVINDNLLIGVVFGGFRCAHKNFPGFYVKISQYRDWIRENSGV